jgi:hypothetical protein
MTKYARLTYTRRAQIESLHWLGHTQKEIAGQTDCHQSSFSGSCQCLHLSVSGDMPNNLEMGVKAAHSDG